MDEPVDGKCGECADGTVYSPVPQNHSCLQVNHLLDLLKERLARRSLADSSSAWASVRIFDSWRECSARSRGLSAGGSWLRGLARCCWNGHDFLHSSVRWIARAPAWFASRLCADQESTEAWALRSFSWPPVVPPSVRFAAPGDRVVNSLAFHSTGPRAG